MSKSINAPNRIQHLLISVFGGALFSAARLFPAHGSGLHAHRSTDRPTPVAHLSHTCQSGFIVVRAERGELYGDGRHAAVVGAGRRRDVVRRRRSVRLDGGDVGARRRRSARRLRDAGAIIVSDLRRGSDHVRRHDEQHRLYRWTPGLLPLAASFRTASAVSAQLMVVTNRHTDHATSVK